MTHAEIILRALDRHLAAPTNLVLFGRAALVLGFDPAPDHAALSLDVDAILPAPQSTALNSDPAFWEALEAANRDLEPSGLYLTHLFEEFQVILRPDWHENIVPITHPELSRLSLHRPADLDLLLTKMMRGRDPQDMADAEFIVVAGRLSPNAVARAISCARVPEVTEIQQAFEDAQPLVLDFARRNARD